MGINTGWGGGGGTVSITANRAAVSNGSGALAASATTATEIGYISGLSSAVQTQLNAKAASSHNHAASDINSGTIDTARLGSGTANSGTYLRGDQTWAAVSGSTDSSYLRYSGVAAYGSTNTNVWRFTTAHESGGTDITYVASSTAGDSFTVNTSGIYTISVYGTSSPGNSFVLLNVGASINNTVTLTNTTVRGFGLIIGNYSHLATTWTGYIESGHKIWVASDAAVYNAAGYELTNAISIARVA